MKEFLEGLGFKELHKNRFVRGSIIIFKSFVPVKFNSRKRMIVWVIAVEGLEVYHGSANMIKKYVKVCEALLK